jgi:hypothetical protein
MEMEKARGKADNSEYQSPEKKRAYEAYYANLREENSWAWSTRAQIEEAMNDQLEGLVVSAHERGNTPEQIGLFLNLSLEDVQRIIAKYKSQD